MFQLKVTGSSWTITKFFNMVLPHKILCYESYNQFSFFFSFFKTLCSQQYSTLHCPIQALPDERGVNPCQTGYSQTINTLRGMGEILEESNTLCSYLNLFQVSPSNHDYWNTLKCSSKSKAKNIPYISQIGTIIVLLYRGSCGWFSCNMSNLP